MTKEEAIERVKLCIDKADAGELSIDLYGLWQGRAVNILAYPEDICFVRTNGGDFGILSDGSVVDAVIERKH